MTDPTNKKLYYAALALALLFGAYNFWPIGGNSPIDSNTANVTDPDSVPTAPAPAARPADLAAKEEQPWGASPFRRKAASGSTTPTRSLQWILSGIIYSAKSPVAIINNKTLGVGDIIDRARVKGIGKDTVTLEYNGIEFTLTVTKG